MTCNDKCTHFPVCEQKKYDFANIDECQYYEEERPHGEWIPCSERLPEESGTYLVTIGNRDRTTVVISYFLKKCSEWDYDEVVAWMPLPKPYKKEGEAE